jgi:hypothetical protein
MLYFKSELFIPNGHIIRITAHISQIELKSSTPHHKKMCTISFTKHTPQVHQSTKNLEK